MFSSSLAHAGVLVSSCLRFPPLFGKEFACVDRVGARGKLLIGHVKRE